MTNNLKSIDNIDKQDLLEVDVLSMGHFNVLHPGHFRFINFAASKGKNLCIILKDDDDFDNEEKAHFFPAVDRADALGNIPDIKHIITRGNHSIEECLNIIRPKFFVLGHEFKRERSAELDHLMQQAEQLGIEVIFHSGDRTWSLNLPIRDGQLSMSRHDHANQNFMRVCSRRNLDFNSIIRQFRRFSDIRTLVIGDLIIDEFIASEPLGLSSEAPVIVVKELEKRQYIGGAGVVASHVASLGAKCFSIS